MKSKRELAARAKVKKVRGKPVRKSRRTERLEFRPYPITYGIQMGD